jgi:diguanylate cyclase (GGDEF)-like protein
VEAKYEEIIKRYRIEFIAATMVFLAVFHFAYMRYQVGIIRSFKGYDFNLMLSFIGSIVAVLAVVSYPKIYKFKITLSGAALVSFFINLLLVANRPFANIRLMGMSLDFYGKAWLLPDSFGTKLMLLLLGVDLLAVIIVNSTVNFSTGRFWSVFTFFFNIAAYVVLLNLIPAVDFKANMIKDFNAYFGTFSLVIIILTFIFSFMNIDEEHNYGSIVVSMSIVVFYLTMHPNPYYKTMILAPLMGVLLITGIIVHWIGSLLHKAHYDPLLKIYNRQYLDSIVSGLVDSKITGNLGVLMCDIDHFKKINDTFGHAAGDVVLTRVARLIRETALPEGIVCRYGGEEIMIFLREKTAEQTKSKAEQIRRAVKAASFRFRDENIKVTVSIGAANTKEGLKEIKNTIKKADDNVYRAKDAGRDRVVA